LNLNILNQREIAHFILKIIFIIVKNIPFLEKIEKKASVNVNI